MIMSGVYGLLGRIGRGLFLDIFLNLLDDKEVNDIFL
jgi:hypothetical protein